MLLPLLVLGAAQATALGFSATTTPQDFVRQAAVQARLQKLLGLVPSRLLQKSFQTSSVLQQGARIFAFTGCQAHACAQNGSLVIYDRKNDAFQVFLTVNSNTKVMQAKRWSKVAPLNSDVRAYIGNM